ncbi:MAG: hypothetical protein AB4372_30505 [Xenococcus sp. (in: cyanobacteria)]
MNRLSQTLLPLALSIGLVGGLEIDAIASPRHSQYNRSGVVIVSPSRQRSNNYNVNSRYGRSLDSRRRNRYSNRDYRPRRSRRYNYSDCGRRNRRVGRRNRRYYSGQRIIVNPPIYRNYPSNSGYIRVIRY